LNKEHQESRTGEGINPALHAAARGEEGERSRYSKGRVEVIATDSLFLSKAKRFLHRDRHFVLEGIVRLIRGEIKTVEAVLRKRLAMIHQIQEPALDTYQV
jgi:hypothetical protein